jgi:O-antigen/teichoic acid export membrane protein
MEGESASCATAEDVRSFASVGRGTTVMVVGTLVLFAVSFGSRVAIAHWFSLTDWGVFNLALAFTGLLAIVALFGLDQAAARSLSFERDPAVRRSIVRYAVAVAVATAVIASVLVYTTAPFLAAAFRTPALALALEILSVSVGFQLLGLILAALFQGCEDAAPNAMFNQIVNPGLFMLFVLLAVLFHLSFTVVLVSYSAAGAISILAFVGFALRRLPERLPAVTGRLPPTPRLWGLAVSFWGVGSLAFATAFVDTLILGFYRPAADVGIYSAAMVLARVLLVGNGALTYIYLPVAARLGREGRTDLVRSTYLTGTRWSLLLVTPVFLLFFVLPGQSLSAVFGPTFLAGGLPLQILAIGAFLSVVAGPANACMAGLGATRSLLVTTGVSAVTNVALSLTLIPVYGTLGAALAWGVARAIYPGLGLVYLFRSHRITTLRRPLLLPLLFALVAGGALLAAAALLHLPAWWVAPLGLAAGGLAVVGLLATRSVLPGDLAAVQGLERLLHRPLPRLRGWLADHAAGPATLGGTG